MDYLTRNELIVQEINHLSSLRRGEVVRVSENNTTVTTIGSYHSKILGEELYLALKEYKNCKNISSMASRDLAIIQVIASKDSGLLKELPLVHAFLQYNNSPIGIITEDFSQGGKFKVHDILEYDRKALPRELADIVNPALESDDFELARVGFLINGKRRLGDFGPLLGGTTVNELLERFPLERLFNEIDKHTVTLDYLL